MKLDPTNTECKCVKWIAISCEHGSEYLGSIYGGIFLIGEATLIFWRQTASQSWIKT